MRTRKQPLGDKNLIGHKIIDLRAHHSMTQKQLMSKMQVIGVDINYTSLSKLEGRRRIATDKEIVALCKIFMVTPNFLLDFETEK